MVIQPTSYALLAGDLKTEAPNAQPRRFLLRRLLSRRRLTMAPFGGTRVPLGPPSGKQDMFDGFVAVTKVGVCSEKNTAVVLVLGPGKLGLRKQSG